MARRPPALLGLLALALLCWPFLRVIAQIKDEVSVTKPQELREALLSGATQIMVAANLNFNSENWPDPPVAIAKQVTIYSLYRFKLDFCGSSGAPARPLINVTALGSLLVHRVFLRNFLPSVPQNLSGLGPVPALLSSGGPISFRFVVFHFLPAVTWVFDASVSDSFWAREGRTTALSNIYTGQPVQLLQPALYLVKYSSLQNLTAKYSMDTCFAPMDLDSCYADDAEDTALIYCLYTFADSLRNPTVRHIRVFHDIGLDRLAYRRSSPFAVNGSKSYRACPRSQPSINLENLYAAVVVRDAVDFTGLRFKASLATNFTSWPPDLPVLLSLFDVAGSGVVSLNDVVIDVPDLAGLVGRLKALPGCCTADPTRPNLRPELDTWPTAAELQAAAAVAAQPVNGRGVIYDAWRPDAAAGGGGGGGEDDVSRPSVRIRHWVLTRNAWQSYAASALNTYDALNAPSAAAWGFGNVTVRQADNANARALCFGGALEQGTVLRSGVTMVASELELRQALIKGGRYIQVISDMKLTAANWPGGDAAVVINAGIVEVRGCHPQYGKRFTIDLSDLNAIVQARGRLIFQGDLRFINVGWVTVNRSQLMSVASGVSDVSLLGAFAPAAASGVGAVECEGVVIDGVYDPAGFRAEDLLAVLHLNHMTAEVRARNATLRGDGGLTLGFWSVNQTAPLGKWVFTNTDISWVPVDGDGGGGGAAVGTDAPPPPPDGGGGRAAAAPVQIIVPGKGPLGNINAAKRDMVVILLPAHMSGRERHERMAVMEAAISSSLSHPNIVQTYTYGAERVEGAKARSLGMRLAGCVCGKPASQPVPTKKVDDKPCKEGLKVDREICVIGNPNDDPEELGSTEPCTQEAEQHFCSAKNSHRLFEVKPDELPNVLKEFNVMKARLAYYISLGRVTWEAAWVSLRPEAHLLPRMMRLAQVATILPTHFSKINLNPYGEDDNEEVATDPEIEVLVQATYPASDDEAFSDSDYETDVERDTDESSVDEDFVDEEEDAKEEQKGWAAAAAKALGFR
ncbi:hypothetical protein VOLCADRAFT_121499 [Volvox carteri f. nagariensis]|uniref:EF-hand domain-containing protein n=1 Tax=Volvox carteri f. nagariensis TaxID=3068 RepID=D8UC97_VOLCA|nr:uncharacterized protein VOLCADRAFT_121499 [Volvox carteri f. nagariensis]EFJ42609.1 hypothetical protein VOLCADRAFT_121499 [Volvox carteri f. nagariensis]|eukprot:XP_002956260.1 hypothetical protein VOLCADRAFT_121499 [Volvox carteri f. nagariensis]